MLAARKPEACDTAVAELRAAGASEVHTVAFDATDFGSHEAFVRTTFDRFGDFDLVLVAFGVLGDQERAEHDPAAALEIVQTNYTGVVSVTVPLVERLRTQGHGTLVLLSSVAGERVRRSNFVYGSSKAGVDGYYQGLAAALAGTRRARDDRAARIRAHEDDERPEGRAAVGDARAGRRRDRARHRARQRGRVGAAAAALRDVGAAARPDASCSAASRL